MEKYLHPKKRWGSASLAGAITFAFCLFSVDLFETRAVAQDASQERLGIVYPEIGPKQPEPPKQNPYQGKPATGPK